MHESWLGAIYPWAGQYRQVDVSKGDFRFANARQIERLMSELERGPLAELTPCRAGAIAKVANAIGVVHAELVLIHPFREGNGRCARLLATLMGLQAGLPPLRFGALDGRNRKRYFAAVNAAMGGTTGRSASFSLRRSSGRFERNGRLALRVGTDPLPGDSARLQRSKRRANPLDRRGAGDRLEHRAAPLRGVAEVGVGVEQGGAHRAQFYQEHSLEQLQEFEPRGRPRQPVRATC
jgi:hypothetical protein